MHTGDTATVYAYNLAKNKILEYRRDIVEAKLRPLATEETELQKDLKKALNKAKKDFTPKGGRPLNISERTADNKPRPVKVNKTGEISTTDFAELEADNDLANDDLEYEE